MEMPQILFTWGRNVGFTGRMAVLEGKTFTVEKPITVPLRTRAALAESDGINHMRDQDRQHQTRKPSHSIDRATKKEQVSLHSSENSTKAKRRLECGSPQTRQSATCEVDRDIKINITTDQTRWNIFS